MPYMLSPTLPTLCLTCSLPCYQLYAMKCRITTIPSLVWWIYLHYTTLFQFTLYQEKTLKFASELLWFGAQKFKKPQKTFLLFACALLRFGAQRSKRWQKTCFLYKQPLGSDKKNSFFVFNGQALQTYISLYAREFVCYKQK